MGDKRVSEFDPVKHLTKVQGGDYMEVKWRITWFRLEWPHGRIETQIVDLNPDYAVVRAEVTAISESAEVRGYASGTGMVERIRFDGGYLEKAETKAVGRALAMLGFGAQHTEPGEMDYTNSSGVQGRSGSGPAQASPPQRNRIDRLARELKMSDQDLHALVKQHTGREYKDIDKRQASGLIDLLEVHRADAGKGQRPENSGQGLDRREGTVTKEQERAINNTKARLGWSDGKLNGFVKQPIETLSEFGAGALIKDLNKILTEGERG